MSDFYMQNQTHVECQKAIKLNPLLKKDLRSYLKNTWELYELLFSSINQEETFYLSPDPLRNPLIFYWGHTAAFYINKLKLAGLIDQGINDHFEQIFAVGVDPDLPENLQVEDIWPCLDDVNAYRAQVFDLVLDCIENLPESVNINQNSPYWSILMGIEHDRIHFETSSVLIRQLPVNKVIRPDGWTYGPKNIYHSANELIKVDGGMVKLGKPVDDDKFGWDNEFGYLEVTVKPFEASKNLITNAEYLQFVQSGQYNEKEHWTKEGWKWKNKVQSNYPKFWIKKDAEFLYRAMFDEMEMPLDWPVEVNAHEAIAYCNWKGEGFRLLSEGEFALIANENLLEDMDPSKVDIYNNNFKFGSPCPVGFMNQAPTSSGFNDIYGNVWNWLSDNFYPLPGFKPHPLYTDFSRPFFDSDHSMLSGGSWATTGTGISRYYRLWFRRHFFQHAGFRMAREL